jgi:acyl-CoA reductase-like NAD-dependent aldehyde dehydrogenase
VSPLIDPRTGKIRRHLRHGGEAEVHAAVAGARAAQPAWAALTPSERSRRMLRLVELIEAHADEYVRAEQAGTGKPLEDARAEVETSADVLRFYAGALRADLTPASGRCLPGRESWVRWEPVGLVGAIVPWNYPLVMAAWRLGPALAAGNTVVLKPAETTPDSALLLTEHAEEAFGVRILSVVPGDRITGQSLVDSAVDMVAFTGSHVGGMDVTSRVGVRRASLELGGNCPAIVLPDAPEYTYDALVRACTYNAGQSCAAPARVITLRENYHETVERLADAMGARRAGRDFGPLNNADQAARFDRIIQGSAAKVRHVGDLAVDGDEAGGFWRPGLVLADLLDDDPAVVEEVFGPVLTVQAVDTAAEAAGLANSVPQALSASVWSSNVSVLEFADALRCGEVWVNCHLEQTAELPHSGRQESGQGTDLSVLALAEYQRPKTVTVRFAAGA